MREIGWGIGKVAKITLMGIILAFLGNMGKGNIQGQRTDE
jgi:hypothetical protein